MAVGSSREDVLLAAAFLLDAFGPGPRGGPVELSNLTPAIRTQVLTRVRSGELGEWSRAAAGVGFCARPVRLTGRATTVDVVTGEVLREFDTGDTALGAAFVRCRNRRASVCLSCSREYAGDVFHLIRAGVTGGKGVPDTVTENPLVFATLTAPSFGPVHGTRQGRPCRPRATDLLCVHGRPLTCRTRHDESDRSLGQPLCRDCYDYTSHLVWQWWAPELWRRFTIALKRLLAARLAVPETRLAEVATVQYAKVAEYQRRGVVHFHALIRLDGPATPAGFAPATPNVSAAALAELVSAAVARVRYTAPEVHEGEPQRRLVFGRQVDARPVRISRRTDDPEATLTAEQVAGYLAKYSTKSAGDTVDADPTNRHLCRLRSLAAALADRVEHDWAHGPLGLKLAEMPYGLLGKWVAALGFRGHFSTKSQRYALTLGALRRARRRAQILLADAARTGASIDLADMEAQLLADKDEVATTLVIGRWTYAGTGWDTPGDAALATAAAARAREYAQEQMQRRKERGKVGA